MPGWAIRALEEQLASPSLRNSAQMPGRPFSPGLFPVPPQISACASRKLDFFLVTGFVITLRAWNARHFQLEWAFGCTVV